MIIVSAADAGYFDLLRDLLLSLEAARPKPEAGGLTARIDIGLLDLGLTDAQRAWLAPRVTAITVPAWDLAVPEALRAAKPQLRALTARPFLPRYFPGYDTYLWIDADVWVQRFQGIELYRRGAQRSDLAATPHSDRSYPHRPGVIRYRYSRIAAGFGKDVADALIFQHYLNAGVFAARAGSRLWSAWAEAFQQGIDACGAAVIDDQTALNYALYHRGLTAHLLPAVCNWQNHLATPAWRPRGYFCEPYLPHAPIALMHLTFSTKEAIHSVAGLDGRRYRMSLRYPGGRVVREVATEKRLSGVWRAGQEQTGH